MNLLLGPVIRAYADRYAAGLRAAGTWLTFGPDADVPVTAADTWEAVAARFPPGWQPDAVGLWLPYGSVPAFALAAPVPVVGLATDWNLLWHTYRHVLPACDAVLTDGPGVEVLRRAGVGHASAANLFGLADDELPGPDDGDGDRDIDVLFVGNMNPAVQADRLPWLGRVAGVADRYRVVIASGVFGAEYRALVRRAKIVFNRSIRGECNLRAFEAAAGGAVLFQEAENREVPHYFEPGTEYVPYTADDLELRLTDWLARDADRRAVAARAKARVAGYGFARLVADGLAGLPWDAVRGRAARRAQAGRPLPHSARVWQRVSLSFTDHDPGLADDLRAAGEWHALGLLSDGPAAAAGWFARTVADDRVSRLALAAALAESGRSAEAVAELRALVAALEQSPGLTPAEADRPPYPPRFDALRVGWERAAWAHPDDPAAEAAEKHRLILWQAHARLSALTGGLEHYRAAAAAWQEDPPTRAALGCALARAGQPDEAVPHLQFAVAANPFDLAAVRALYQVLLDTRQPAAAAALAAARRRLRAAAPGLVPAEAWFAPPPARPAGTTVVPLAADEFARRFGSPDTRSALTEFTGPGDTHVVLTLAAHVRPRRVLEIGTAAGHMTANLTAWTPPDAAVFTLGVTRDRAPVGGADGQAPEVPPAEAFGREAGHFGRADKVFFVTADSREYDFGRLAPLDFVFVDGGHDFGTVLSDTRKAYTALRPGGCLVWHDFGSPVGWVEVREAVGAAALPDAVYHVAGTQVAFLFKGEGDDAPRVSGRLAVAWHGEFDAVASLARVNRAVGLALLARGQHLAVAAVPALPGVARVLMPAALEACAETPLPRPADVHVRHRWPPDFTPPADGPFVLVQPWEFGSLPRAWADAVLDRVDEVWAYTAAVRDCYLAAGVPADRVRIVPLGVDPDRFRPDASPFPLSTRKRLKFLFVGGTIPRKGFDLLLAAYTRAFRRADDVCLVVKEMGGGTFYRGQTAAGRIEDVQADPDAPEVEYLTVDLTDDEMPGLYAACDCLVLPYRGEGFGLPVLEAMASGKPVVVTAGGATDDFCPDAAGYKVPARKAYFPEARVGEWATVGRPWWLEPDPETLADALRRVAADPGRARAKGAAGRRAALGWTWDHTAAAVEQRVRELRGRPPRAGRPARPTRPPCPSADGHGCP